MGQGIVGQVKYPRQGGVFILGGWSTGRVMQVPG